MEKQEKTYKSYYINNYTLHTQNKINTIKKLLKITKSEAEALEDWELSRFNSYLTQAQIDTLRSGNLKKLKELLKKQIEKEKKKLTEEKEKAKKELEKIAELQDIKSFDIQIEWSQGRRSMGAYQTKASGRAFYKNGTSEYYETSYTSGCGYDKPSTSASELCNKLAKIVLLKHYSKIQKDTGKHYHFYAAENGYFSYGVGINSYITFFKNCGYKVQEIYHRNENITLLISK